MIKIVITADLPDELGNSFLRYLRAFDVANPGCHFSVAGDAPGLTIDELLDMLKVDPALPFTSVIQRAKRRP